MSIAERGISRGRARLTRKRQADADAPEILHLTGEVTLERYRETRGSLLKAVRRNGRVSIDMSGVSYIDSSGIACLVEALQASRKRGGDVRLLSAGAQVMQLLRLTRLDAVFADTPVAPAREEAEHDALGHAPAA